MSVKANVSRWSSRLTAYRADQAQPAGHHSAGFHFGGRRRGWDSPLERNVRQRHLRRKALEKVIGGPLLGGVVPYLDNSDDQIRARRSLRKW